MMSDKPHPNPDKALYTEPCAHDVRTNRIYGQLQDICTGDMEYRSGDLQNTSERIPPEGSTKKGTVSSGIQTGHHPVFCEGHHHGAKKILDDIHHMRWHSGLDKYPYQDGIEGLRTSLICVLNIMSDMMNYIEKRDG